MRDVLFAVLCALVSINILAFEYKFKQIQCDIESLEVGREIDAIKYDLLIEEMKKQ